MCVVGHNGMSFERTTVSPREQPAPSASARARDQKRPDSQERANKQDAHSEKGCGSGAVSVLRLQVSVLLAPSQPCCDPGAHEGHQREDEKQIWLAGWAGAVAGI